MAGRKSSEERIVIAKTYDLILWSCNHTGKFPAERARVQSPGGRPRVGMNIGKGSGQSGVAGAELNTKRRYPRFKAPDSPTANRGFESVPIPRSCLTPPRHPETE